MNYLLDTNIGIVLIYQKSARVLKHLISQGPGDVGISSFTLAKLVYGVEKSAQVEQNRAALQQFILPLEMAGVEGAGQISSSMDLLIAVHTLSLDAILATNNVREFQRVDGLLLEDWSWDGG